MTVTIDWLIEMENNIDAERRKFRGFGLLNIEVLCKSAKTIKSYLFVVSENKIIGNQPYSAVKSKRFNLFNPFKTNL